MTKSRLKAYGWIIDELLTASLAAAIPLVAAAWWGKRALARNRLLRSLPWLVMVLLLAVPAFLYAPWLAMTIRCGHQPVYTTNFAAANSYSTSDDAFYSRTWILGDGYVCSEADADRKGYNHSG